MNFTHFRVVQFGMSDSGKTKLFQVISNDGDHLGEIRWFGRWRKYCFMPAPNTVFEQVCMREVSTFIESETSKHRREY